MQEVGEPHLMFADETFLFCKAGIRSIKLLMETFVKFSKASGLNANANKSFLYIVRVNDHIKGHILRELEMEEGCFPFKYLGVPFHTIKLNSLEYQGLEDKIAMRLYH